MNLCGRPRSPADRAASRRLLEAVEAEDDLKKEDEYEFIKNSQADIAIVVAYGKIIPLKILNIKNIKFINIHASLLPKWRGAAPIQRSIMQMDKETGKLALDKNKVEARIQVASSDLHRLNKKT